MEMQKFVSGPLPQSVLDYVEGWVTRRSDLVVSSLADDATFIDNPHPEIPKSGMKDFLEKVAWVNFPT